MIGVITPIINQGQIGKLIYEKEKFLFHCIIEY